MSRYLFLFSTQKISFSLTFLVYNFLFEDFLKFIFMLKKHIVDRDTDQHSKQPTEQVSTLQSSIWMERAVGILLCHVVHNTWIHEEKPYQPHIGGKSHLSHITAFPFFWLVSLPLISHSMPCEISLLPQVFLLFLYCMGITSSREYRSLFSDLLDFLPQ